jgi:DNA-binding response OmpR family regulator
MQREGHAVRTARDGSETLKAVAESPPDLILLDVMMPRGNGYEVCRTLRAEPGLGDMRIIMLTARGQEADQRDGLGAGADAYVTKPFAIRDVIDCVEAVLARPPAGQG